MSNPSFRNIDLWLFELNEGNLSEAQKEQLRMFLLNHPEFDVDRDMWEKAFVSSSDVEFENEEKLKKRGFVWFPYAAAVLLVGLFSGATYYLIKDSSIEQHAKSLVSVNGIEVKNIESIKKVKAGDLKRNTNSALGFTAQQEAEGIGAENAAFKLDENEKLMVSEMENDYTHLELKTIDISPISNTVIPTLISEEETSEITLKESRRVKELSWSSKMKRSIQKMTNSSIALKNYREPNFDVPGLLPTELNFGNAGTGYNFRVQTMSRLRWMGAENENLSNKVSVDGYVIPMKGGIGFSLEHDYYNQGGVNQGEFAVSYSPKFWLNKKVSIEPSVRFKMGNKSIDNTRMNGVSAVEIDRTFVQSYGENGIPPVGRSLWYKDVGVGVLLNTKWFHLGAQLDNLLRHDEYMFAGKNEDRREAFHFISTIGTDWVSARGDVGFSPYAVYQNKGSFSELWAGFNMRYKWFIVGASISNNFEPMASMGVKLKRFSLRYSADYLKNGITVRNELSHQLTLRISTKPSRRGRALLNI